jgi:SAM-dependent methyltransferase
MKNVDDAVVRGFGDEWQRFDQRDLSRAELEAIFTSYFAIFPWQRLPPDAVGFDAGCGSGRWASFVAPRVGRLHCIDASAEALAVARRNLSAFANCELHHATVDAIPLAGRSCDFGYSLGVLHHIPDTAAGIAACVSKLKPGAPFLLYLYYAFDNRPPWYRAMWRSSELLRGVLSRAPRFLRHTGAELTAALVYFPLARTARLLERAGANVESFPLSFYRNRSYYVMRTDALDRFGTRLEKRFTRAEIAEMMRSAGLRDVTFSDAPPFWCAVGIAE